MFSINRIGAPWLAKEIDNLTDSIKTISPSAFNENKRYLPSSVTSMPGYLSYDVNPFMREIIDCFDVDSLVREVNLQKGVQITFTTLLESIALYYMAHIKTLPIMYMTADKELAEARIENNFIPMINQSGFGDIIRTSDEGNTRKTGKTKNHIQFDGGGYLVPFGAINANKMRSYAIAVLLKDELDAWPDKVGKDGNPDKLSDDRCSAYWEQRKIFRGSTPLIKGNSKINDGFLRGDQRRYMVLCKRCNFPQYLRWKTEDKKTGIIGGMQWETENGQLVLDSVNYACQACGEPHFEHYKHKLFSESEGAHWKPFAIPKLPDIRSYHLPALYSPIGMQPWYKCVADYLDGFDPETKKVIDIKNFQVFYNNILAEPFEIVGSKIQFVQVSGHRRAVYRLGTIPNEYAEKWAGSKILFLTCQVDVHKSNLAVSVMGWTKDARCFLIDYWRLEAEDAAEKTDPVWGKLQRIIEEKIYEAGKDKYRISLTLIDAGYANDTVTGFCSEYASGVYPILGRDRPAKNQRIREFDSFKTQNGTIGYRILVDHYKDRMGPVLRREWHEEAGPQPAYHFNAPIDTTDKQLQELTVEQRREKKDPNGATTWYWHRPGNARNELWDLLGYGHAAVDIMAYAICIKHFELENVDWAQFWEFAQSEENNDLFGRINRQ